MKREINKKWTKKQVKKKKKTHKIRMKGGNDQTAHIWERKVEGGGGFHVRVPECIITVCEEAKQACLRAEVESGGVQSPPSLWQSIW